MIDTSITHFNNLPGHLRKYGSYDYLTTHHQAYWFHAIDVAHMLLDRFETERKNESFTCYYQDQFDDDFIAAIKQTDLGTNAKLLGPFELFTYLPDEEKVNDPHHVGYREALEKMKAGPRGMAVVFKSIYDGPSQWKASVHCGGGYISDCLTMPSSSNPATLEAIWENLIGYEGYLARKQAEREKCFLKNYAQIRELKLRQGTSLRDVEMYFEGKRRRMNFVIKEFSDSGQAMLVGGKMRGSRKIFTATINALEIKPEHLTEMKSQAPKDVQCDTSTLALF